MTHAVLHQLQVALAVSEDPMERYRLHPERYLEEVLGVRLYPQFSLEIVRDIATSWLHLHAREAHARGEDLDAWHWMAGREDLPPWQPGADIPNVFVLQGGHKQGKSVIAAALLLWALHVSPRFAGVVYAPLLEQARDITWKYLDFFLAGGWGGRAALLQPLRASRQGGSQSPMLQLGPRRQVVTKAVGAGVRIQGRHEAAAVHLFEEADGIESSEVYDAVRSMTSGGCALWLLCLNPATRGAPAQQLVGPRVRRYTLSCIDHPNVVTGQTVIPGAVDRAWVEAQLDTLGGKWATRVAQHDPACATFELSWRPGEIYRPLPPWWWRVWGRTPPAAAHDAIVSETAYSAAEQRGRDWRHIFAASDPRRAALGVDVARSDSGTGDLGAIARRWRGCLQITDEVYERDTRPYVAAIVRRLEELLAGGCLEVEVRVDAGGGYGGGVVDQLKGLRLFERFRYSAVIECHFSGAPQDPSAYDDWVTEAYAQIEKDLAAGMALVDPPAELQEDLCTRKVHWVVSSRRGIGKADVRRLERKEELRRRLGRSPDRGDALALACAPWRGSGGGGLEAVGEVRWGSRGAAWEREDGLRWERGR